MKAKYRNIVYAVVAGTAMIFSTGCKKFLDVNDNPNSPKTATDNLVLPSTQAAIGMIIGNNLQVFGGFYAQYWTQSPAASQYRTIDQYQSNSSASDRVWSIMYNDALTDIKVLEQSKNNQYVAIGLLEKAYLYQVITDAFGDVPLKDAVQGNGNLAPKYDTQKEVYDSIFAWTKRGIALAGTSTNYPGNEDLIFGGGSAGMANWKRFGNTLLLKAYLRLSEVDSATAKAGVQALYATNPTFLTTDARIAYQNVGGNYNPLYAEGVGLSRTQNLVASSTAVSAFNTNSDPRVKVFYTVNAAGNVVSIPQGSFSTLPATTPVTYPAPITGGRFATATGATAATAPVKLFSIAESNFLQAEAVARGWAPGDANALFLAGIQASFTAYSVTGYAAYVAAAPDAQFPATVAGRIKAIITQKYYAMCGTQNFEAWTEYRRTGYPTFLIVSLATRLGNAEKPARLLYPDSEITRNTNFPGLKTITEKVWWDK